MQFISALELRGFRESTEQGEPQFNGNWVTLFDTVERAHAAKSEEAGAELCFPSISGSFKLVFMGNAWSGMIQIEQYDEIKVFDLFSEFHNFIEIEVAAIDINPRKVSLKVIDDINIQSSGRQIWFHGIWVEHRQTWIKPSRKLNRIIDTVNGEFGTFVTILKDVGISYSIREFGAWGIEQVELFKRLVCEGANVLDIGANIGHHTVVMSHLVGPTGQVHAFEPQPFVHRVLQANLALNNCDNARAYMCALGSVDGTAVMEPMSYERDAWNVGGLGISIEGEGRTGGEIVALRRLDDIPEIQNIDFIKCDAQGFDFEVMKGGTNLI